MLLNDSTAAADGRLLCCWRERRIDSIFEPISWRNSVMQYPSDRITT